MRSYRTPQRSNLSTAHAGINTPPLAFLLVVSLLVLVGAGGAARADEARDGVTPLVEDAFPGRQREEDRRHDAKPTWEGPWLDHGDEGAADRWVRHLRVQPWHVTVLAYAFDRLPDGLEPLTCAASPLLDAAAEEAVVSAVRDGSLHLVRAVRAAGHLGDVVRGQDLDERTLPLRRDIESAIAVVTTFPEVARVREGLRLRATLLPAAAGGATVRYRISLLGPPEVRPVDTIGGELDEASLPAFLAQGTTRFLPGDVQALWDLRADGGGQLLLLSAEGPAGRLEPVADLGGGLVAVLAEHLGAEPRWLDAEMAGVHVLRDDEREEEEVRRYEDAWDAFARTAGARPGEVVWDGGPLGLFFGIVRPDVRERLRREIGPGAVLRRARALVEVLAADGSRMRLPVCPGTSFRFFQGRVGTEQGRIEVESGCHTCVRAVPNRENVERGIAGAGFACTDGTVDLSLRARLVLHEERKTFPFRRVLPGYEAYDFDAVTLPLVRDRVLAFRSAQPEGDGRLPAGLRLDFRLPADAAARAVFHVGNEIPEDVVPTGGGGCFLGKASASIQTSAPVRLRVNGEPFAVRPGVESTLHDVVRHPLVRIWVSGGWCGMRTRHPTLLGRNWPEVGVPEGASLSIRAFRDPSDALLVDVSGELFGAPEDRGPFDPGDGVVSIVRSPTLSFESHALPLGRGQMVAEGAGLQCRIEPFVHGRAWGAFRELAFTSSELGSARLRTGPSDGARLEAGGTWLLPGATDTYVSGHGMGEATTSTVEVLDGVTLVLEAADLGPTLKLRIRSRPTLAPYALRPEVKPPLPLPTLRLLDVGQRDEGRELRLDVRERLDHVSPDPSFPYVLAVRLIPPEPAGASR